MSVRFKAGDVVHGCVAGSATTRLGLPAFKLNRLQSVLNAAARLVFSRSKYDHVTPLLQELHWLRIEKLIEFKLSVLVFRCLNGLASSYLSRDLQRVSDLAARRRLRSSSTSTLVVPPTRLSILSAIAPSPLPRRWHGTVCPHLSHRYLHWRLSGVRWRRNCSPEAFLIPTALPPSVSDRYFA